MIVRAMEPYGAALQAYYHGRRGAELIVRRDDGQEGRIPLKYFFRDASDLTAIEKAALDRCSGSILDIGAGSGIHSLALQQKGLAVTALDINPQAADIMRSQGVKTVVCSDIFAFTGGPFDTLLLLGHGIGMVQTMDGLQRFLNHAGTLVKPGGRILLDSLDVTVSRDPLNLTYHMWYSHVIIQPFIFRIGYARSSDGIHWTKVPGEGVDGAVLDWGHAGSFDELSTAWPAVIKTKEGFMMWYFGYSGSGGGTGCAVSSDGIHWNRVAGGEPGGACLVGALGLSVLPMDDQFKMWYAHIDEDRINLAFSQINTGLTTTTAAVRPEQFSLEQNYPNPFNAETTMAEKDVFDQMRKSDRGC
ncbi:methyltransferase domain-containing protein [candidate division KSB1 bacterium]|nr:methyltransferase domain-containing protein [candidate division KSB1 bacterium]